MYMIHRSVGVHQYVMAGRVMKRRCVFQVGDLEMPRPVARNHADTRSGTIRSPSRTIAEHAEYEHAEYDTASRSPTTGAGPGPARALEQNQRPPQNQAGFDAWVEMAAASYGAPAASHVNTLDGLLSQSEHYPSKVKQSVPPLSA
jgi:hypothetical protein